MITISSIDQAWGWVFENWGSSTWIPVPKEVKTLLGLHHGIGVCGYNLITKVGANGLTSFVNHLNHKE